MTNLPFLVNPTPFCLTPLFLANIFRHPLPRPFPSIFKKSTPSSLYERKGGSNYDIHDEQIFSYNVIIKDLIMTQTPSEVFSLLLTEKAA